MGTSDGKETIYDYYQNALYLGADIPVAHNLYGQLEMARDPVGNFLGNGASKMRKTVNNHHSKQVRKNNR